MRKKSVKNLELSDFRCTKCGNKGISIFREAGRKKEAGHLKEMFCFFCNSEQNFVELKPSNSAYTEEMFWVEFNGGNFIQGKRKIPYRQFIGRYKHEKNLMNASLLKLKEKTYERRLI